MTFKIPDEGAGLWRMTFTLNNGIEHMVMVKGEDRHGEVRITGANTPEQCVEWVAESGAVYRMVPVERSP